MKFTMTVAIVGLLAYVSVADKRDAVAEPTPYRNILVGGRMAEAIAFDPSGKLMVTGGWECEDIEDWREGKARGVLKLWNTANGQNVAKFEGSPGAILNVAFSPDGALLATVGRVEGDPHGGEVKVWDVKTRKVKATFRADKKAKRQRWELCAAFSPDGKWLATGGFDKTAKVWNVETGKLVTTLPEHSSFVQVVRFTRDGKALLTADRRGVVTLWDAKMWGGKRAAFKVKDLFLLGASVSTDGKLVAVSGQLRDGAVGHVSLWDVKSEKQIAIFETRHIASSTAISPDGKWLAGYSMGEVQLWNIASQEELTIRRGHGSSGDMITFAPDGKLAFTCTPGTVSLWLVGKPND